MPRSTVCGFVFLIWAHPAIGCSAHDKVQPGVGEGTQVMVTSSTRTHQDVLPSAAGRAAPSPAPRDAPPDASRRSMKTLPLGLKAMLLLLKATADGKTR
jgi:hypothetical protein